MTEQTDITTPPLAAYIQSGIPIVERPFADIADRSGMTEAGVINTIIRMSKDGIIREFGPVFEPKKLGYITTLVAAEVEDERIGELSAHMLDIPEITHNYLREHVINLWFTINARSEDKMADIIAHLEKFPGVGRLLNLPVVKVFKIRAVFGAVEEKNRPANTDITAEDDIDFSEDERNIVRALQMRFPFVERPFKHIAERAETTESIVIDTVNRWVKNGVIRRFGARLNHRRAGYTSNTLGAWKGRELDDLGRTFAELPHVSHCYRRTPHPDWPYELYTMIHAQSKTDLSNKTNAMRETADHARPLFLKTCMELKKTGMKYFLEDYNKQQY